MSEDGKLFTPGRLCLFGEHSDWAGGHRRQNSELERGYAIVAPTNQGNYATVRRLDEDKLIFKSRRFGTLETSLDEAELLDIARKGGVFSYVAGVAYEIMSSYHNHSNGGLEIDNYHTDLPIKKGLSSSASICVLVAKAFNELFALKLKPKRIMDVAYIGETTTPSRCGRLDQACAYGAPILMTFDADYLGVKELEIGADIPLLIVDLKGNKDTKKILSDLNRGFPFPTNEFEMKKQEYLGRINKEIVMRAVRAISDGNAENLGELMKEAQKEFDRYLSPASPEELKAPILHSVLEGKDIQKFIYGGKGVGSQGDGSVQLVCKSDNDREKVKEILSARGFDCIDLDLKKSKTLCPPSLTNQ